MASSLLLLAAPIVSAHAELQSRTPRPSSTVPAGPVEIIARFSEQISDRSSMTLRDASNAIVAQGAVDGRDLRIGLEGLLPGAYEVRYTVISSDGHVERSGPGSWPFTVAEAATASPSPTPSEEPSGTPAATAEASPSPADSPSPTATPAPSPPPGSTATGGDVVVPIVVALVVVLGGLAALLLRGRRSA